MAHEKTHTLLSLTAHRIPLKDEKFSQSWTAEAFPASIELPREQRWPSNQDAEKDRDTIEVRGSTLYILIGEGFDYMWVEEYGCLMGGKGFDSMIIGR